MMVGSDVTIINGGGLQVTNTCVMPEIKENGHIDALLSFVASVDHLKGNPRTDLHGFCSG